MARSVIRDRDRCPQGGDSRQANAEPSSPRWEATEWLCLEGLKPNKYGDRSNAIRKRFGEIEGSRRVWQSARLPLDQEDRRDPLGECGVSENIAADIVGHEKPRITYGVYSAGVTLAVKRAAVSKLRYP
jgi:hypothetical protein